jgi:hypothetical protein
MNAVKVAPRVKGDGEAKRVWMRAMSCGRDDESMLRISQTYMNM